MDKVLVYGTRDSGFDPQRSRFLFNIFFGFLQINVGKLWITFSSAQFDPQRSRCLFTFFFLFLQIDVGKLWITFSRA
jgi:hypothetical protein